MNKQDDEVIFNLLLMNFWNDYKYRYELADALADMDEYTYNWNIQMPVFIMLKDCFPEKESCFMGEFNYIRGK